MIKAGKHVKKKIKFQVFLNIEIDLEILVIELSQHNNFAEQAILYCVYIKGAESESFYICVHF